MHEFSLRAQKCHLFVDIEGADWLLDTGAPESFGATDITIGEHCFSVPSNYMGLAAEELTGFVGHPTSGIVGADILNKFDVLIDTKNDAVSFSTDEITLAGESLEMTDFMEIPIIQVNISGADRKMFFDTGAQISYFQDDSLDSFPAIGTVSDFYPGFGKFETDTYQISTIIGASNFELRCGSLPEILGTTLMMAGVEGIIGNELIMDRALGYFPRRQKLVIA